MEFYKSRHLANKTSQKHSSSSKNSRKPTRSFRNSRDDKPSRYSRNGSYQEQSTAVTCSDCGTECSVPFVPRNNKPVYCNDCFRQNRFDDSDNSDYSRDRNSTRHSRDRNSTRHSRDRNSTRHSRDDSSRRFSNGSYQEQSTAVICSDCGTECSVPFVPRNNKPVYCNDCFRQNRFDDSDNSDYSRDRNSTRHSRDRNSTRHSRDRNSTRHSRDRNSTRHSRDDSSNFRSSYKKEPRRSTSKSKKSNDKFLRKQESFFSNGSDKFYKTIQEKLFEILGGKICSNCGFKDERALRISSVYGDTLDDDNKRGTFASSLGKYISAPKTAREELKVLCLNCNQIREPVSKPSKDRLKPKKSKYFPR